jgi:hypothetical protein
MCRILLFLMMLGLSGLAACSHPPARSSTPLIDDFFGGVPETLYFPAGTFSEDDERDLFSQTWYSQNLERMEEPVLSCAPPEADETYRFLWLRTFHNPVAVRIFEQGNAYRLEAVVLDGAGGYDPGHISRRISKEPSATEWQNVMAALEEVRFWQMPVKNLNVWGFDGAQWIIEACHDGRYHVVDRWGGANGIQVVGQVFLNLAGLSDIEPVY